MDPTESGDGNKYDVIVCGTGLTECILSGLLSVSGKKVLHVDRNDYYGAESTSMHLEQLFQKFRPDDAKMPEGERSRDYAIDLVPKFIAASGNLVKVLMHTKVTRYLDFKLIAGCYATKSDGSLHKVPATAKEALSTSLVGFFSKRRLKGFLEHVQDIEAGNKGTYKGFDCDGSTAKQFMDWWKLDEEAITFVGHAMALYTNDKYFDAPCLELVSRVRLYAESVSRYGSSPFIYPLYGLSGLPEGFSRLAAVHGGTYMLNTPVDEILKDGDGKARGIRSGDKEAYAPIVLCDPTYVADTDKVRKTGQVATSICILNHPLPNTNDADSAQIIVPASSVPGRDNDLYVACTSYHHNTAAKGKYIAVVTGTVEDGADAHKQLIPALKLLGSIENEFFFARDTYEPTDDGKADNIFVSHSYDATSHFESATLDVLSLYERMTGEPVDLTAKPEELGQDE